MLRQVRARSVFLNHEIREMGLINPNSIDRQQVIILHSLLGARDGWRVFMRGVERKLEALGVGIDLHMVDFRHHGLSPNSPTSDSTGQYLTDCVMDLDAMIQCRQLRRPRSPRPILIGHSMGGKVALLYSLLRPERVRGVVSLDAAPAAYTHSHQYIFEAMKRLDLDKVTSRQHAIKMMAEDIPEANTRAFVATNLISETQLDLHKRHPRLVTFPPEARRAYEYYAYSQYGIVKKSIVTNRPFLPQRHEDVNSRQTLPMCWRVNVDYLARHEHHIHEWPSEYTLRTLENASLARDGHFKLTLNLNGLESDPFAISGDEGLSTLDADVRHYYRASKAASTASAILGRLDSCARSGDEEGVANQIESLMRLSEISQVVGVDIGLNRGLDALSSAMARESLDALQLGANKVASGDVEYGMKGMQTKTDIASAWLDRLRTATVDAFEATQAKLETAMTYITSSSSSPSSMAASSDTNKKENESKDENEHVNEDRNETENLPRKPNRSLRSIHSILQKDTWSEEERLKVIMATPSRTSHSSSPKFYISEKADADNIPVLDHRLREKVSAANARYYPPGFAPKLDLTSSLRNASAKLGESDSLTLDSGIDPLDRLMDDLDKAYSAPRLEKIKTAGDTPLWDSHPVFTRPPELLKNVQYPGPVLFIGGKSSSRLTTDDYTRNIPKTFPGHTLELLPGGHFVHNGEGADECARLVAYFIRTHMSTRGEY